MKFEDMIYIDQNSNIWYIFNNWMDLKLRFMSFTFFHPTLEPILQETIPLNH